MDPNCKVYARQIPYEWQESPWDLWGSEQMITDKAAIYGDKQLQGYTFAEFDNVLTALDEMDLTDVGEDSWYTTEQEMLLDYVPPVGRNAYTAEEIEKWKAVCDLYDGRNRTRDEQAAICAGLTLVMGKEYDYRCLRGCCQRDWNYFYYPVDLYNDDAIRDLEIEYFNMGEEWMIHDEETVPDCAEAISGYTFYVYDDARKEIAAEAGVEPEDVVLWGYGGMMSIPTYKVS